MGEREGENFCPLALPREARLEVGSGSSLRQQGSKARKIASLIEKDFCARPLKNVSIFAGFVRRQATSRGVGCRAAGAASGRVLVKKSSDFVQKVPPIFRIRILGDCCLALATLGLGFRCDFEGIFEIQKQFLPAQTEVRRAKHG